jgi:hypothetical protein
MIEIIPTFEPNDNLATLLHQQWIKLLAYKVTATPMEEGDPVAVLDVYFTNGRRYFKSDVVLVEKRIQSLLEGWGGGEDDHEQIIESLLDRAVEVSASEAKSSEQRHYTITDEGWQYTDEEMLERVALGTEDPHLANLLHKLANFLPEVSLVSLADPAAQVAAAAVAYAWSTL